MSQFPPPLPGGYPNPYAPMNPYGPEPAPARPASRAAGILEIVIGVLTAVLSFCLGLGGHFISTGRLSAEGQTDLLKMASEAGVTPPQLLAVMGICVAIPALLFVVLGIFVWRGVRWVVMTSIVLTCLTILWLLANLAEGVIGMNPVAIAFVIVPLAMAVVLLVLLIRAWRETRPGASQYQAQLQQYYQQYYQYQQTQQMPPGAQGPAPTAPQTPQPPTPGPGPSQNPPPPPFR